MANVFMQPVGKVSKGKLSCKNCLKVIPHGEHQVALGEYVRGKWHRVGEVCSQCWLHVWELHKSLTFKPRYGYSLPWWTATGDELTDTQRWTLRKLSELLGFSLSLSVTGGVVRVRFGEADNLHPSYRDLYPDAQVSWDKHPLRDWCEENDKLVRAVESSSPVFGTTSVEFHLADQDGNFPLVPIVAVCASCGMTAGWGHQCNPELVTELAELADNM